MIHRYTRAQALADGALIDAGELAREAGFTVPLALTAGAWAEAVAWDHGPHQDETGRLWDVLTMAGLAARTATGPRVAFTVARVPNQPGAEQPTNTTLHLHIGPGDTPAPVLTVLLPHED